MTAEAPAAPSRGTVTIRRHDLAGSVLNRVLATAAAQAELPLDRVGDVLLLGDELVARAPASQDGVLRIELEVGVGRLDLRIGPLLAGAGRRTLEAADVAGLGNVFGRLADDARAERLPDGEAIVLVVSAERTAASG